MVYTRKQIADAVHYWGQTGTGGDALSITKEASKLVDVLATMDFQGEQEVEVADGSVRGDLLATALQALAESAAAREASSAAAHAPRTPAAG